PSPRSRRKEPQHEEPTCAAATPCRPDGATARVERIAGILFLTRQADETRAGRPPRAAASRGRELSRQDLADTLKLVVGWPRLPRIAEPGLAFLHEPEELGVGAGHRRRVERERELVRLAGRDRALHGREAVLGRPLGTGERAVSIARLGGGELRVRVPRLR